MGIFAKLGQSLRSMFSFGADPGPTKPAGADGVPNYSGYVYTGETAPDLVGRRKWITYANGSNAPIVATGLRAFGWLLAGTTWNAVKNDSGSKNAQRGEDIVRSGLINARMPQPWPTRVRKQAMYRWMGSALHAWKMRRREDGMMVFASLDHRPMHTIDRWDRPDPQGEILGVSQLLPTGERYYIKRSRLWYSPDDTLSDAPDGVGLLRHVVEIIRRLQILEALELHAYQTDLRGMPIGTAPLAELARASGAQDPSAIKAFVDKYTADIRNVLENSVKDPEKAMYLLLDSEPFKGADPNTIASVLKWGFQLVKGDSSGKAEVAALVERLHLTAARCCGFEHIMMGGTSSGSHAMHSSKTDMFEANIQATLTEMAGHGTNDLARPLVAYNGLDPDVDTPTLVAEPVSQDSILSVAQALAQLSLAGGYMPPNWDGWDVLLDRARLPPRPEMTPAMMGMIGPRPRSPATDPTDPKAKPDPAKGEVDVPLDDLGDSSGERPAA